MTGQTLSHYKILDKLGEGGMGVLYRAFDTHLDRTVAIKILRPEAVGDPERKRRFVLEAKAASALNHPNIITIYDIDQAVPQDSPQGTPIDFIAMEYIEGRSLDRLIPAEGMAVDQALGYAVQIASALAAAHAIGIVHRDIKPANIMVTGAEGGAGLVKVLDFGLAKLTERIVADEAAPTATAGRDTQEGAILGTVAYMSPEQAEGKPVDGRSDVFSFGVVLYEMLAGRRPFQGDSNLSTLLAILRDPPAPLENARADVPADLDHILLRCLEKNRESRYPSGGELWKELAACQSRRVTPTLWSLLRRPRVAVPALALLLALATSASWLWVRTSRLRWARGEALPQLASLIEQGNFDPAFRLARQAQRFIPADPQLRRLHRESTVPVSIRTTPPGAEVYMKGYLSDAPWLLLGRTPIENFRAPLGYLRWKVSKPGFEAVERAFGVVQSSSNDLVLEPQGAASAGMVRVPACVYRFRSAQLVELPQYWIDKYEVTNRQYKEFLDRGGYQKREYWKYPFLRDGRELSWEEAMAEFRDTTGRTGPSNWEFGTDPQGRADFPVSGVSWYEAAAYAEFAGKSLPTIYHWYKAAGIGIYSEILRLSNFGGQGPAPVGSHQGLSPYGSYDMAGNVKEWCWNQTGALGPARRYILGGAWNEPSYMFNSQDAASPFDRSATHGFRCARYSSPLPETLTGPIEILSRDYSKEKPVSDEVFRAYRSLYAYDRTDLNPVVESVDESSGFWRKEKISFNAAYGNERVIAYLLLPRNAVPPYQTVIYFPGTSTLRLRSSENLSELRFWDFLIRSGRALLYPVYKGAYERRISSRDWTFEEIVQPGGSGLPFGPNVIRDLAVQWSKDLGRSIDYLETRKDIDHQRLAYHGLSLGACWGPVLTAMEPRFKASVLLGGGLIFEHLPSEVEGIHFAPRVHVPTLMLNGRHDFMYPLDSSQAPLFRLLGVRPIDKRHVLFESGHLLPRPGLIKEALDWLDHYLGPVKTTPS
ncbi:MAG: protein kinase [Acidobacteria bacterium]|nr:protein kinase [Acidobacteriota bacterium]